MQDNQREQGTKGGRDSQDDGVAQCHAHPGDSEAKESRANPPSKAKDGHLEEGSPRALVICVPQVRNRCESQCPR